MLLRTLGISSTTTKENVVGIYQFYTDTIGTVLIYNGTIFQYSFIFYGTIQMREKVRKYYPPHGMKMEKGNDRGKKIVWKIFPVATA